MTDHHLKNAISQFIKVANNDEIVGAAYVIITKDGSMQMVSATNNNNRLPIIAGIEILKLNVIDDFNKNQNVMVQSASAVSQ